MNSQANKPRILVVEDEAIIALDIQLQLVKLGYEPVGHATRCEEAIALAGELRPDLVLMDIQLGGEIDGIAAADAIRTRFALPVVFLTAFAADETLARAKLAEPFGYILKPFSDRDLRTVIEMALYKYEAREKLRESEELYRTLSEEIHVGVIIQSAAGEIILCNPKALALLGLSADQLLGKTSLAPDRDVIHEDGAPFPAATHPVSQVIATGRPVHDVVMGVHRSNTNERVWLLMNAQPQLNPDGSVRQVLSTFADITERKQAQAATDKAVQRLQIALEGSQISVWEFDLRTHDVWLDAAWATFLDHPAAETHTTALELLALVHPKDRRRVVAAAIKTLKGKASAYVIDHRVKTPNGGWCWVHSRGRVIERDPAGQPLRMSGTNTNITRHKQDEAARALLETQLQESQRLEAIASLEAQLRESQKMEAIGTLAGGIAHDFNNILATILGNTELARLDASASPLALESLEEIHKAATRARDLVQQILSFSRRQPTTRKRLGLAPLLQESARLLRSTLPARVTLEVHCDAALPAVMADATQIQQVLINLATNAMQAMDGKPGRVRFHLDAVILDAEMAAEHPVLHTIHTKRPGPTLRLAVSDNGSGMDAATLGRVFEPFFTTKSVNEGTGLGLSVVHGIVQAHDGVIAVSSQPGRGATFTLYLPAAEADAPEPKPSPATARPVLSLSSGYKILYLDDDHSLVFLVKRLLERRGCHVSAHTNQREALDTLRADPGSFDLVVTDYNMPGMSGLDVAREVRLIRADLPVAVASGFIDEVLSANAEGAGVRELIFKANSVEDFCATVLRLAETGAEVSQAS